MLQLRAVILGARGRLQRARENEGTAPHKEKARKGLLRVFLLYLLYLPPP